MSTSEALALTTTTRLQSAINGGRPTGRHATAIIARNGGFGR